MYMPKGKEQSTEGNAMWIKGTIDGYSFYIKRYDESSEYGISGGRISKLEIWKDGQLFVQYDRGWSKKPNGAQVKKVYEQILREYN